MIKGHTLRASVHLEDKGRLQNGEEQVEHKADKKEFPDLQPLEVQKAFA